MTAHGILLADEQATLDLGARIAASLRPGELIFLEGDLGMGKTTLVRGLLRALGYEGTVKSPTYTLMEPYEIGSWRVYHLDLYRIVDPAELDFLGLDDIMDGSAVVLVEWPERASGVFRAPDRRYKFRPQGEGRVVES
jgi:tRNA threonylcarbamoyladenosine biosynthesis protein TsaE